ncbi:MAG: leucine-rich repeat protein, partial [Paludibacteraceae bacterium]|nr:leucine-rich repeat protein [Paludibacteraceae bacterium]
RSCPSLRVLEIPEGVTTLEENFIKECKCLKTVILPSTIREIGSEAFQESKITEIVLPEGVETIGTHAFANCKQLESVTCPSSLKKIKAFAFENCKKLKRPKNLKNVSIHRDAYRRSFLTACLTMMQDLNSKFHIAPFLIIMTVLSIIFSFFFHPILSAIVLSFVITVMIAPIVVFFVFLK